MCLPFPDHKRNKEALPNTKRFYTLVYKAPRHSKLSTKPTAQNPSSEGKKSPVSQHNADDV